MSDQGWRTWTGGICPVDPHVKVEYRLRNTSEPWSMIAEAGQLRWDHGRTPESASDASLRRNDIVAYRPTTGDKTDV